MNRRVRMQDVAALAGVSRATASYVLNDRADEIPADTCARVLEAAQRLGYRRNRLAQNLTRRRSGLIGIVLPDLRSPFFGQVAEQLHRAISAAGYQPLFRIGPADPDDPATRTRVLDQVLEWGADGALVWWEAGAFPITLGAEYRREAGATPLVFLGSGPPPVADADGVWFDIYAAGRLAAEHLLAHGHRRIAVLGGARVEEDPRFHAVRDALAAAGQPAPIVCADRSSSDRPVTLAPLTADSPGNADLGRAAVRSLLNAGQERRPTAIIAVNDLMALGALRSLIEAGCRVPDDISLVSCDETWVAANLTPALTAVEMPFAALAERGAALLSRRLAAEDRGSGGGDAAAAAPVQAPLTPTLRDRESVAPPTS